MRHTLPPALLLVLALLSIAVVAAAAGTGRARSGSPEVAASHLPAARQATPLPQETPPPERVAELERRVERLEGELAEKAAGGALLFLFGAFCALWAQNTGRSAMMWFLAGLAFNVLTVLVVLHRNGRDADDPGLPAVVR